MSFLAGFLNDKSIASATFSLSRNGKYLFYIVYIVESQSFQINILNFIYVLFVLGTHDDFLDSGTLGCQYLLFDATHGSTLPRRVISPVMAMLAFTFL